MLITEKYKYPYIIVHVHKILCALYEIYPCIKFFKHINAAYYHLSSPFIALISFKILQQKLGSPLATPPPTDQHAPTLRIHTRFPFS